ncbi:hypothetical protein BTJ40_11805 [Microbulbifer sp. A4B17]|uniref:PhnD/SsuA/transferrin family substrate-binding protein n=1 Tax=Microbulbifer sp. A4B17 TaxID=359370 RepID=UPI000D52AE35|nr:PhnD/SsuA/transferrin family substrate-binding protein [Microbulbifer sp. A4B17]AWF81448.1 hypothetical protein BTJ40_11805 [Microbulbifer sp. A4B17]
MKFTFGSKDSTSGRLMPEYFIREAFDKPSSDIFQGVGYCGDHSNTLDLVQSGKYQVGVLNYKVWEDEKKAGKVDENKVQVIWKAPGYPNYNWTIRGDVGETWGQGFSDKLQQAILDMRASKLLAAFSRKGFIKADNSMCQPIVETAYELGILQQ